jgi:hypothetical protein
MPMDIYKLKRPPLLAVRGTEPGLVFGSGTRDLGQRCASPAQRFLCNLGRQRAASNEMFDGRLSHFANVSLC